MQFVEMDDLIVRKLYWTNLSSDNRFKLIGRQGDKEKDNIIAVFCRSSIWSEISAFVKKYSGWDSYAFNFTVIDLANKCIGYGPLESQDLLPFWILKRRALLGTIAVREREEITGILTDEGVQLLTPDKTPIKNIETYPPINNLRYHDQGCILPREIGFKFCEILQ